MILKKFENFINEGKHKNNTDLFKKFFNDLIKKYIPNNISIYHLSKLYNRERFDEYSKEVYKFNKQHDYLISITFENEKVSMSELKDLLNLNIIKMYKPLRENENENPRFILSFNIKEMKNDNVFKSLSSMNKYKL